MFFGLAALLAQLISIALSLYIFVIILQVAISWLIAFEVINANNEQAQNLIKLLKKITDPVYGPVRKFIPPIGGIDLTPLVVIIGLQILATILIRIILTIPI